MFQDLFHTIKARKSSHTYSGQLPNETILEQLNTFIAQAPPEQIDRLFPSTTRFPEIKLINVSGETTPPSTYGVIKGASIYAAVGVSDRNSLPEMVTVGIMFERLILKATELGLATCWLGGTFSKSGFMKAYMDAGGSGNVIIVSPVGYAAPDMRLSEKLMRTFVKSASRKSFDTLFKFNDDPMLNTDMEYVIKQKITTMLEGVRLAPSSRNSQPWRGCIDIKAPDPTLELRCVNQNGAFAAIDMGIALCHLMEGAIAIGLRLIPLDMNYETLNFRFSVIQPNQTC